MRRIIPFIITALVAVPCASAALTRPLFPDTSTLQPAPKDSHPNISHNIQGTGGAQPAQQTNTASTPDARPAQDTSVAQDAHASDNTSHHASSWIIDAAVFLIGILILAALVRNTDET